MSDVLFLYKKLTVSSSMDLGEDSLKFSINLSKKYADMLNELTKRSGLARAQIARMLLCTALDEIDQSYNLQNLDDFDYEATLHTEEMLSDLNEARIQHEIQKESNRIAILRMTLNCEPETEEEAKMLENVRKEVEEYDALQTLNLDRLRELNSVNKEME